jgi:hypothetical protein
MLCIYCGALVLRAAWVLQLMQSALQLQSHAVLHRLCKLPGAAAIASSNIEALLMSHIQRIRRGHAVLAIDDSKGTLMHLCYLPAAKQLQPRTVQELVLTALRLRLHRIASLLLFLLPAAQQLDGPAVLQMLTAVVVNHDVAGCMELDKQQQRCSSNGSSNNSGSSSSSGSNCINHNGWLTRMSS